MHNKHPISWLILSCLCALTGCAVTEEPGQNNTNCIAACDGQNHILLAGDRQVWTRQLIEDKTIERIWLWGSSYLLAREQTINRWYNPELNQDIENNQIDHSDIVAFHAIDQNNALVTTKTTLYGLGPDGLSQSPLTDHFKAQAPTSFVQRDQTTWLANNRGVYIWKKGVLSTLATTDAPTTGVTIGEGPSINEHPTVWAFTAKMVYAIEDTGTQYNIHIASPDRGAQSMASSKDGLWIVSDGEVLVRNIKGQWRALESSIKWQTALAHPGADGVWLVDETKTVWHFQNGTLTQLKDITFADGAKVDAQGRLLVVGPDGIQRHDRRLAVSVLNLDSEKELRETKTIDLDITFPSQVQKVVAHVGDQSLDIDLEKQTLTLDPKRFGPGAHTLDIALTYKNTIPTARLAQAFQVATFKITWSQHIKPIYESSCSQATCHGEQSTNRPFTTPEKWETNLDLILSRVKPSANGNPTMPPGDYPPLTPLQLNYLAQWKAQGFLQD